MQIQFLHQVHPINLATNHTALGLTNPLFAGLETHFACCIGTGRSTCFPVSHLAIYFSFLFMHLTVVCGNTCFRLCGALFHVHNSNAFDGDGDGFVNASQKSSYAMTIEK